MITLLTGENSFELDREIARIINVFDGRAERIDGSELELRNVPDLLMGSSLFAEKRLVIIKGLSESKSVWSDFGNWLERLSNDIQLVLIESKPDKRTKTFKQLQKVADIKEFKPWGDRDVHVAEKWAMSQAREMSFDLTVNLAKRLVERTGIDQWRVFHGLEKLSVLDIITAEIIEEIIDANPVENIFQLFETALSGNVEKAVSTLQVLALTEDPYQVFGLLSGQAFQLAVLNAAEKPGSEIARDIGAHPFVLSKLSSYADSFGRARVRKVLLAFADADEKMKTSAIDPWLLIERALIKTATA